MAITDSQKVDYLLKKIGYGIAKTDTLTNKSPANESVASPLLLRGENIWQQSGVIATVSVLPTANSNVASIYRDTLSSTIQTVNDGTSGTNRTWKTNLTDWIGPEFGSGYAIKVYAGTGSSATPQNFTQLMPDGSGNTDSWYFDYQAGVLNFADTNVPTAVTGNVVYISGARYVGTKGLSNFPGGVTISNITITGNTITGNNNITFGGNITANNIIGTSVNVTGDIFAGNALFGPVASANFTRFPNAQVVVSNTVSGIQQNEAHRIGIIAEGVGDPIVTSVYGIGVYGVGYTNGATRGTGIQGEAHVSASGDAGAAIGIRGYSTDTHSGANNIALYADASGSSVGNYALWMNQGNINSVVAQTWTLLDNTTSALSLDTSGKSGILKVITTDNAEGITTSGYLTATGNITGNTAFFSNITGNVLTPYQPYITTVGLLTNLQVTGTTTTSSSIYAPTFVGNITTDLISSNTGNITLTTLGTGRVSINANTSLRLPSGTTLERPTGLIGDIRVNSTLGVLEYYGGSSWIPLTYSVSDQSFSGDGTNYTYSLDQTTTAAGIIVSINGTIQQPQIAYTVAGNQITFAEIPLATDAVSVRYIASAVTVDDNTRTIASGNIVVGTTVTIVDSFDKTFYRSAKYTISSHNAYDDQLAEILVLQGNNKVVITTTSVLNTGANTVSFSANITGLEVNLLAQGTINANNLRIQRTYFNI